MGSRFEVQVGGEDGEGVVWKSLFGIGRMKEEGLPLYAYKTFVSVIEMIQAEGTYGFR